MQAITGQQQVSYTRRATGPEVDLGQGVRGPSTVKADVFMLKATERDFGIAFSPFCGCHATDTHVGYKCSAWQAEISKREKARADQSRRTEASTSRSAASSAASYASRARAASSYPGGQFSM